jgi:hypothetical protein
MLAELMNVSSYYNFIAFLIPELLIKVLHLPAQRFDFHM